MGVLKDKDRIADGQRRILVILGTSDRSYARDVGIRVNLRSANTSGRRVAVGLSCWATLSILSALIPRKAGIA